MPAGFSISGRSVEDAGLVGWDHVLDVNESVLTSVRFETLEGLLDKVTQVLALSLRVVDLVSNVLVAVLEEVEYWEDLSVVWHESLTDGLRADNESLQHLESNGNDFWVASV